MSFLLLFLHILLLPTIVPFYTNLTIEQSQSYKPGSIEYETLRATYEEFVQIKAKDEMLPALKAVNNLSTNQVTALLQREGKHLRQSAKSSVDSVDQAVIPPNVFLMLDFDGVKNFYNAFKAIEQDRPEILQKDAKVSGFQQFITDLVDAIASVFKKALVTRSDINEAAEAINKLTDVIKPILPKEPPAVEKKDAIQSILAKGVERSIESAKSRGSRVNNTRDDTPVAGR